MLRTFGPTIAVDPERVTHVVEGLSHGEVRTRIFFEGGESVDVAMTLPAVTLQINEMLRGARGRR